MTKAESLTSLSWTTRLGGGRGVNRTSSPQGRQEASPGDECLMSDLAQIAEAWRLHEAGALTLGKYNEMKRGLLASPRPFPPPPPPPVQSSTPTNGNVDDVSSGLGARGFFKRLTGFMNVIRGHTKRSGRSRSVRIAPLQCRCR